MPIIRLGFHYSTAKGAQMKKAFTLVELLVVIAIIGVLMALLVPAVQYMRESSRKTSCMNNLRQQVIACHSFMTKQGQFPNGGLYDPNPIWNYPPYIHIDPTTKQIVPPAMYGTQEVEAWGWAYQSLAHIEQRQGEYMISHAVPMYFCPSRRFPSTYVGSMNKTVAGIDYAGNGGYNNTPTFQYPNPESTQIPNGVIIPVGDIGIVTNRFHRNLDKTSIGNIPDGATETIMLGERGHNYAWDGTKPDEDNGYVAGWTWDTIRWGYEIPQKDRNDPTYTGGSTRFGSSHDVVLFAYCDGRVSAINYEIEPIAFHLACSRNDSE